MNDKELLLVEQIVKEALADLDLQEGVKIKKLAGDLAAVLLPVLFAYGVAPHKFEFVTDYVGDIIGDHFAQEGNSEEELEKLTPYTGEEKPSTPAGEQDLRSREVLRALYAKGDLAEQVLALFEARKSTKGYIYEVTARMITSRDRNKSEIINDLRAIKYVTVVSIVPGQNFALQKTPTKEKTLIKIKFHPKGSPLKTIQKIKASAFGRSLDTDCPNAKVQGLLELDIKRDTLTPVRTY
jgi:hypothetical protein